MAVARGGKGVKTKLGFLTYGEQGTWKSSFCLEFLKMKNEDGSPMKVLYLDPEQGSIDAYLVDYEEQGIAVGNLYLVYTQSLTEVSEFIEKAKNGEDFYVYDEETGEETDEVYLDADGKPFRPDAIVVDGVSLLYTAKQQGILEFSKKRARVRADKNKVVGMAKEVAIEGASLEVKDYNTLKFDGQNLILDLIASGKHYAVTCREKDEKESYKDKNGEIKMMATGRKEPEGFKDVRYNVKTVLHMFEDDDGVIKAIVERKDRTKVHDQGDILVEPTMLDWQSAIDKNKGKKDYVIENNLSKAVEKERKSIEKEAAKFDGDFEESSNDENQTSKLDKLEAVEDYHAAIQEAIRKLNATEKAKIRQKIKETGLNQSYTKVTKLDELKTYLEIVTG